MKKPIVGYKACDSCSEKMPIIKYYEQKRFCSAKCRSRVIKMPPRPDRTGTEPWNKGKKLPDMSKQRMGDGNPMWKGDNVSYSQLHKWVNSRLTKPKTCQSCDKKKRLFLSNISYKYKRTTNDWEYLCQSCHITKDRASQHWGKASRRYGL